MLARGVSRPLLALPSVAWQFSLSSLLLPHTSYADFPKPPVLGQLQHAYVSALRDCQPTQDGSEAKDWASWCPFG